MYSSINHLIFIFDFNFLIQKRVLSQKFNIFLKKYLRQLYPKVPSFENKNWGQYL